MKIYLIDIINNGTIKTDDESIITKRVLNENSSEVLQLPFVLNK